MNRTLVPRKKKKNRTFSADLMSPMFFAGTCTSSFFLAAEASSTICLKKYNLQQAPPSNIHLWALATHNVQ